MEAEPEGWRPRSTRQRQALSPKLVGPEAPAAAAAAVRGPTPGTAGLAGRRWALLRAGSSLPLPEKQPCQPTSFPWIPAGAGPGSSQHCTARPDPQRTGAPVRADALPAAGLAATSSEGSSALAQLTSVCVCAHAASPLRAARLQPDRSPRTENTRPTVSPFSWVSWCKPLIPEGGIRGLAFPRKAMPERVLLTRSCLWSLPADPLLHSGLCSQPGAYL